MQFKNFTKKFKNLSHKIIIDVFVKVVTKIVIELLDHFIFK